MVRAKQRPQRRLEQWWARSQWRRQDGQRVACFSKPGSKTIVAQRVREACKPSAGAWANAVH
jgi:hypothetical protein